MAVRGVPWRTSVVAAAFLAVAAAGGACASDREAGDAAARPASALPPSLPASTGRTYYVAAGGDDRAAGTRSRPWRTIQRALDRLRPGERLLIGPGTYTEDLVVRRAGTPQAPITVAAQPGARVVLHPASTSGDTYPVRFRSGASYVRLRGFVIENARGTSSTNVYFEGSAHHIELTGNEIRFSQDQGIFSEETTRNLHIVRNRIHDNGRGHVAGQHQSHGIYLEGARHLVANNAIYDHPFGFGVQVYPNNHESTIVSNTIVRSGHSAIVVGGHEDVFDITIRNNILAFNASYGVQMDSDCPTDDVEIDTNVIFGNRSGSVEGGCSEVRVGKNVGANPRFVSRSNFRLNRGSPAIDRANANWSPRVDLAGRRRPGGRGFDIGALERQ